MPCRDRLERRLEIDKGYDFVDLCCGDERGDAAPGPTTFVVAGEECVLPRQGDRPDEILHGIGVDLDASVLQEGL